MKGPLALESSRFRLLVEGPDDQHTVVHLMRAHGVDYDMPHIGMPYVCPCGGWTGVDNTVPTALKNYDRLGMILDADLDLENRWVRVRSLLLREGLSVPNDLPPEGLVVAGKRPASSIGVWLMPDNQTEGMLENFLRRLVPSSPLWDHACESVSVAKAKAAPFQHAAKAQLHTWLSWQEPPGQTLGMAMKARWFQTDAEEATRFATWFRRTFPES